MLLATHPEIQEKIVDELKQVFFSDDVEISYDNILKLDLLERVIKESLRLCPVVPSKFDHVLLIKVKQYFSAGNLRNKLTASNGNNICGRIFRIRTQPLQIPKPFEGGKFRRFYCEMS